MSVLRAKRETDKEASVLCVRATKSSQSECVLPAASCKKCPPFCVLATQLQLSQSSLSVFNPIARVVVVVVVVSCEPLMLLMLITH